MSRFFVLSIILVMSVAVVSAQANWIVNGDFEDTTGWGAVGTTENPANWPPYDPVRKNPAGQQSGANAIDGTSAYMPADYGVATADRKDMENTLQGTPTSLFQIDFDFASEDPGSGDDRSMTGSLYTTGGTIVWRVVDADSDGVGDLQMYKNPNPDKGYHTVLTDAVTFDDDVTTTPVIHHFTLVGHYDGTNASYDITITNASSQEFTATGLTYSNYPVNSGDTPTSITFNTFNSKGDYLLDNVSVVPEPGTVLLLAVGMLCVVIRRRHG